ncbi:MAG: 16S rRNA (guanine(527)-N(7))-methyltransferase RsmG [Anaerolineaceae bacterium]|jgi:16S rRNA (guanine527-N7)-methyltransferase|nr:MAG: 16S rRNA (guanine(527)-N(7))-methyltransferase RsmG [Anaerolineaceae bacterium]
MQSLQDYYNILTGSTLSVSALEAFEKFQAELLLWNEQFNLTAIRSAEEIERKHFMDALSLLPTLEKYHIQNLIDIGTGAGFPGIPLKIVNPSLPLVLVESVEKKAAFCRHILQTLDLKNAEVVVDRAEVLGQNKIYREQFDCAAARAVAALPVLLEYLLPLVRVGGIVIAQKSASVEEEISQARNACAILGGGEMLVEAVSIPGLNAARNLVIIEKIKTTPPMYPRRVGLPTKKPL